MALSERSADERHKPKAAGMEAFIKVPTSGTVLAVDLCLCTWYSPFPIIDLGRGGAALAFSGGGGWVGGGGVGVEEESQVSVLGTVLCEGATRNFLSEQTSFSSLSLSHTSAPVLLSVLVHSWLGSQVWGGGTTESRAAPGRTGEERLPVLGWQPGGGGRESLCGSWPGVCPLCALGGCWDLGTCVRAARFDLDQASPAKLAPKG